MISLEIDLVVIVLYFVLVSLYISGKETKESFMTNYKHLC